jgi:geranylgeranyl pyrophosphate synthase
MEIYLSDEEKILTEPVKYYTELKGKNIRKYISNIFGKYLGIDDKDIENIDEIISIIHNASLVIDDIQDNSFLRRNQECAHIKYGIPLSINASYLCIFKILNEINKREDISENTKHKIIENIYLTHIGQGMDIYYTQHKIIPNIESYNTMMEYKTGMLFFTILDLMMERSKNVILKKRYHELRHCLYNFSLFFQIRDDYINLTDPTYWKERGFCQDFDEQKISYPITYCTNNKMENYEKINNLMTKLNKTNNDKIEILKLMKNNGLLDIIFNKLLQLRENILNIISIDIIFQQLLFSKFDENNLLFISQSQ